MPTTPTRLQGDLHVTGTISAGTLNIPASTIVDADVSSTAAIDYTKLEHQDHATYAQSGNSVDETKVIHTVHGATCTLLGFEAGSVTPHAGADVCTIDLQKDGVSVLAAPITLDNTNVAYTPEAATINTTAGADGDVYTVVQNFTTGAGTPATGVYATLTFVEDPQ